MDSLKRIAVAFSVVAALAWAMVAYSIAETTEQPRQTVPEAGGPGASGSSTEPLSRRLDRSGGVIKPPAGIDPGLAQAPPGDGRTPVIKPPGSEGSESGIRPK